MTLTIKINMDNAAFGEGAYMRAEEVGRILAQYVHDIVNGEDLECTLRDFNGNTVGAAVVSKD